MSNHESKEIFNCEHGKEDHTSKKNLKDIWKYTDLKKMLSKTSGVIQVKVLKSPLQTYCGEISSLND